MGVLTKNYQRRFIPAVQGEPPRAAETVCTTLPPPGVGEGPGSWQYQCNVLTFPVGYSLPHNMGQTVTVLEVKNGFVKYQICGSVWVPNG